MILDDLLVQLRDAAGDPERMALAAAQTILSVRAPDLRAALDAAAVPHSFDGTMLSRLLDLSAVEASALTDQLASLPMVEPFPARNGWNVHEATRLALRRKLAGDQPDLFIALSASAAVCWQGNAYVDSIEAIYHRLSSDPEQAVIDLKQTYYAWGDSGHHEAIDALGTMLEELYNFPLRTDTRGHLLIVLGWIWVYRRPLADIEAMAREAFEIIKQTGRREVMADAHSLLGFVLQRRGQGGAALEHYLAEQGALEELVNEPGVNRRVWRDLANCCIYISRLYIEGDRINEALEEIRKSQKILIRLIASEPDNISFRRDLSLTHSELGRIYERQDDLSMALAHYEADKKIGEEISAAEPENLDRQRDLAVSHNNIGRIYTKRQAFGLALEEFQTYRHVIQGLVSVEPLDLDLQRELFVAHLCIARTYGSQQNLTEASVAYEAGNRILRSLIEIDADNARTQRDLYRLYDWHANLYFDNEQFSEALIEFRNVQQTITRLLTVVPLNTQDQRALALAYGDVGRTYEKLGEYDKALTAYQEGLRIAESVSTGQPVTAKWQQHLQTSTAAADRLRARASSQDPTSPV